MKIEPTVGLVWLSFRRNTSLKAESEAKVKIEVENYFCIWI